MYNELLIKRNIVFTAKGIRVSHRPLDSTASLLGRVQVWSLSAFMALSKKERLCHGKDPKHKYDTDGHVRKSKRMVRADVVLSAIYML
jgi:hypothetical protein